MKDVSPPAAERLDGPARVVLDGAQGTVSMLCEELAVARRQIDHLQRALVSNRRIGAAMGILMYRHKIEDDEAFHLLRAASQTGHRKLHDVAEDVINKGLVSFPQGLPESSAQGTAGGTRRLGRLTV